MSFMSKFNLEKNKIKLIIKSLLPGENLLATSTIIKRLMKETRELKRFKKLDKAYKTKELNRK
jgi:hypothetical protein